MNKQKLFRMDGLVLYKELEEAKTILRKIKNDFIVEEGFSEEDVKEYLQDKIINNL